MRFDTSEYLTRQDAERISQYFLRKRSEDTSITNCLCGWSGYGEEAEPTNCPRCGQNLAELTEAWLEAKAQYEQRFPDLIK